MKASTFTLGILAACIGLAGCDRGHTNPKDGIVQTKFPGQVTAGGMTSGQIMAHSAKPETNAVYGGGSPFIAGGSGGNTAGAAMGGTVSETGQGPSQGITKPTGAIQGGNQPLGEGGKPPADAAPASTAPANAAPSGPAANVEKTAPAGGAPGGGAQPASTPAAPGTLTGSK
jgi:hypothetical protein